MRRGATPRGDRLVLFSIAIPPASKMPHIRKDTLYQIYIYRLELACVRRVGGHRGSYPFILPNPAHPFQPHYPASDRHDDAEAQAAVEAIVAASGLCGRYRSATRTSYFCTGTDLLDDLKTFRALSTSGYTVPSWIGPAICTVWASS